MASLDRNVRRDLETAVKKARRVAEAAARQAIEQLAVGHHEPWPTLTPDQRKLRNRLRAHGRQLGDRMDERKGTQAIERLVGECAYEHWHRLLFARFLAENDLLVEPDSGVSLSLAECRELSRERGVDWLLLASEFAQKMLPQIFRSEDPVLDVSLPPEKREDLEKLLETVRRDIFLADDSLGWSYQYWQDDEKDRINEAELKIGGAELPAVTQLFTESYMVQYLVHNTLGAWWAAKKLAGSPVARSATSEAEVRAWLALPGVEWNYLRLSFSPENGWHPAAGPFATWPKTARELRVLDPSMGSGHFLVAVLPVLAAIRSEEDGLAAELALRATLADNLFGLEIDPRCSQVASFALALTAWKRIGRAGPLPSLHLACCGYAPNSRRDVWTSLAKDDPRLIEGMARLFDLFAKAPVLGSLIDPRSVSSDLFQAGFDELAARLEHVLAAEEADDDLTSAEMAVVARKLLGATRILLGQYHLVITNVPYLVKGKQCEELRSYCESYSPEGAADLAAVFIQRCRTLVCEGGTHATVSPQNWLYLKSYKAFRRRVLREHSVEHVARVGSGATSTASWDVLRALLVATRRTPVSGHEVTGIEVSAASEEQRAESLRNEDVLRALQKDIQDGPDCIFAFQSASRGGVLGAYASALQGISTGDSLRLVRSFWELASVGERWRWFQIQPPTTAPFVGRSNVVDWESLNGGVEGAAIRGESAWTRRGVAIAQMRTLPATLYGGTLFSNSTPVIVPKNEDHLPALWAFCCSSDFNSEVRRVNAKMSVDNGYLKHVRFDLAHWNSIAKRTDDELLPASTSPTQWLFDGSIVSGQHPLQVATALLVGFSWPSQRGESPEGVAASRSPRFPELADADGIACLSALNREASAADRIQSILAAAHGESWSGEKMRSLLDAEDAGAGLALEEYLRDQFFSDHCALFEERPFVWQVWDGLKGGFSCLVNYHRLVAPNGEGRRTLEKLIYTYLGDWIERQRAQQAKGEEGADARVVAADHLKRQLENILEGEPPYDLFARWKPLHQQSLGWDPDINDGVRMNIRPFLAAKPLNARGKNACILRVPPKLKWDKDRGKEQSRTKADFPWFWGWDESAQDFVGGNEFDGNRWNDLHYSRAMKLAARERAKEGK